MWEAQTPWITRLLPVDHTGALGNSIEPEGHLGAGSCVNSLERVLSFVSPGHLLGRDSWQGQRGQRFPSPTLEVTPSSLPLVLHGLRCHWECLRKGLGVAAVVHPLGHGAAYCRSPVGALGRQSMPSLPSEAAQAVRSQTPLPGIPLLSSPLVSALSSTAKFLSCTPFPAFPHFYNRG